jgi:hypothetical protein
MAEAEEVEVEAEAEAVEEIGYCCLMGLRKTVYFSAHE